VKPGYSPYEQYATTTSQQGPWTDIYSLGATLYHAVTGKRPPDAPSRMLNDEYVPAKNGALSSYRPTFLAAIDKALRNEIADRPQTVAAWRAMLLAPESKADAKVEKAGIGAALGIKRAKTAKVAPEKEPAARVAARVKAPAPATTPPQPDAEQGKGQLLDFIDAIRKPGVPADQPSPAKTALAKDQPPAIGPNGHYGLGYAGAANRTVAPPAADKPREAGAATKKATRKAKPKPPAAVPVAARRMTDHLPVPEERNKPRRVRNWLFFLRPPWRGYAFKLGVGVGIASLAVAFQGDIPRPPQTAAPAPPSSTTTSSIVPERIVTAPSAQLSGHKGAIQRVAFTHAGRTLVSVGTDGTIRTWDAESAQAKRTFSVDQVAPTAVIIDERTAMTVSPSGLINAVDLERAEKLASVAPGVPIAAAAPTSNPGIQAVAIKGSSLALIDQNAPGKPVAMAEGHDGEIRALLPLLSRTAIASAGSDRMVRLWSADALAPIRTYRGHTSSITALSATDESRSFASASADGQVKIWSTASTRLIRSINAHAGPVTAIAYAPASDLLASAGTDGKVRVWDTRRRRLIMTIEASRQSPVRSLALAPDGTRLLSGHDDGMLRLWDTAALKIARD
jgi:WD40 repeat protein